MYAPPAGSSTAGRAALRRSGSSWSTVCTSRLSPSWRRAMSARKMGDPLDEDTDIGPQARVDLRDDLHRQVTASIAAGAELVIGGRGPARAGSLLSGDDSQGGDPGHAHLQRRDVWAGRRGDARPRRGSCDRRRQRQRVRAWGRRVHLGSRPGRRIAATRLEAGSCFVNAGVASDPRLPFGGIKQSGYGRELADAGIREFVNSEDGRSRLNSSGGAHTAGGEKVGHPINGEVVGYRPDAADSNGEPGRLVGVDTDLVEHLAVTLHDVVDVELGGRTRASTRVGESVISVPGAVADSTVIATMPRLWTSSTISPSPVAWSHCPLPKSTEMDRTRNAGGRHCGDCYEDDYQSSCQRYAAAPGQDWNELLEMAGV